MKNSQARRNRRATVINITMCLLRTQTDGMRAAQIQKIISDSCRFRCSVHTLSQIMRPHLEREEILRSLTSEGHSHWKLNPVYIPPVSDN
jgi:hypothetical protein